MATNRTTGTTTKTKTGTTTKTKSTTTAQKTSSAKVTKSRVCDPSVVSRRAWEIWNENGCPQGRDLENWLQAEKELKSS